MANNIIILLDVLEIKVLDNTIDNIYKNEYDRSDKKYWI